MAQDKTGAALAEVAAALHDSARDLDLPLDNPLWSRLAHTALQRLMFLANGCNDLLFSHATDLVRITLPHAQAAMLGCPDHSAAERMLRDPMQLRHLSLCDDFPLAEHKKLYERLRGHPGRFAIVHMTPRDALEIFPKESLDMVLVTRDDIALPGWIEKLRRGGVMAGCGVADDAALAAEGLAVRGMRLLDRSAVEPFWFGVKQKKPKPKA